MQRPTVPGPTAQELSSSIRSVRAAGWGLVAAAPLSVLLLSVHPTTGALDFSSFVERAGRGVPGNTLVHGSLITLVLLMTICFLSLRDVLGAQRWLVRAGMSALVLGSSGAVAAGLINGFVVPNTASHFVGANAERLRSLEPVLAFAREVSATSARVGVVGLSLSAVAWSVLLAARSGWRRAAGVAGLVCGLMPIALHVGEHLRMNVTGYSRFVQVYSVWAVVAGVVLIRHRAGPASKGDIMDPRS